MGGWLDGRPDRWMDGWMDGWMDVRQRQDHLRSDRSFVTYTWTLGED